MNTIRAILKRPSSTVIDYLPDSCVSCHSTHVSRIQRSKLDLKTNVQRRYLCRACYATMLIANWDEPKDGELATHFIPAPASAETNDALQKVLDDLPSGDSEPLTIDPARDLELVCQEMLELKEIADAEAARNAELQAEVQTLLATIAELKEKLSRFENTGAESGSVLGAEADATTLYQLGMQHLQGDGAERNHEKATGYFAEAAQLGHAPSRYNLALCRLNGVGGQKCAISGRYWALQAAQQGHQKATVLLEKIQKQQAELL